MLVKFPDISSFQETNLTKQEKINIGLPSNGEDAPWGLIQ